MNVYIIAVSDVIKILLYGSPARLSYTCKLVYLNEMCPLASQDKMCLQFITKKKPTLFVMKLTPSAVTVRFCHLCTCWRCGVILSEPNLFIYP